MVKEVSHQQRLRHVKSWDCLAGERKRERGVDEKGEREGREYGEKER